jgi:hypothetical protein
VKRWSRLSTQTYPKRATNDGAGEGNRTLTVSLGNVPLAVVVLIDGVVVVLLVDRGRPMVSWVNGTPMARRLIVHGGSAIGLSSRAGMIIRHG